MLYSTDRVLANTLSNENYISTENMLSDFCGICKANNVPSTGNVIVYQKGDILLSNIRPYLKKVWMANNCGGCSADVFVMKADNDKCISDFLYYLVANDNFINYVMSGAKGIKMPRGDKAQIKKYQLSIPSKSEQYKITEFLHNLDVRITTQNKIIEELKSLIFVVNKRLLYGNNSTEYVRLGEIATITNGTNDVQDASLEYTVGLYPFYDRSEIIKYLNTYFLDKEAIIYPGEGSEFLPRYHNGKFALHQRCYAIYDIKNEYMVKYLYYYMQNLNNYFIRNAVGSTVPSLRLDTFKRIKIPVLPICEQRKICNVLDTLSNKLQIEQECLSKYQLQKQYLLQRMFI